VEEKGRFSRKAQIEVMSPPSERYEMERRKRLSSVAQKQEGSRMGRMRRGRRNRMNESMQCVGQDETTPTPRALTQG
jgi:hypothetical protein